MVKLLLLMGVGVLLDNSFVLGERLNSGVWDLASKARNITLLCGAQHIELFRCGSPVRQMDRPVAYTGFCHDLH